MSLLKKLVPYVAAAGLLIGGSVWAEPKARLRSGRGNITVSDGENYTVDFSTHSGKRLVFDRHHMIRRVLTVNRRTRMGTLLIDNQGRKDGGADGLVDIIYKFSHFGAYRHRGVETFSYYANHTLTRDVGDKIEFFKADEVLEEYTRKYDLMVKAKLSE